ncbi:hypothetical protein M407DRAFT_114181 [Tulasnella calospora MUT 4182]|uniref:Protein kinase domain-containing protein n=1 Tax=Tulasnella calospora MUT 4182 TaxID=1051891 RepID=A0A0C3LNJ7_9AGAM|nr:hypothetical protein M407DRAFT_114181 [Tulasnella calospora MUT 4182]
METSQSELGHGDKSNQAVASVDPTAANPPQALSASEVEPTSNAGRLPTVRVDASAAQEVAPPEEGRTTQGNQTATSPDFEENLAPTGSEDDSLVQPGRQVRERELPSELSGALTNIREHEGSVTRKKTDRTDGGAYADIFEGELDQPDGSKIEVAIKCIRGVQKVEGLDRRVRREAFIWTSATHPNILQFIGYKVMNGEHCLISPWCKHGSLTRYILNNEGIKESEKLKLLCDAARGLVHLHSLNPVIVHGDIKPDNVLVKDNLEAALCDFGISRIFLGIGKVSGLTTTGNRTGGTAGYQARELLDETAPSASTAGDVYAFGGLILAAMSGKNPFYNKRNDPARIVAVCTGEVPSPDDHPRLPRDDPLWDLLNECWSNTPEARPAMDTVLQKLESERDQRLALGN